MKVATLLLAAGAIAAVIAAGSFVSMTDAQDRGDRLRALVGESGASLGEPDLGEATADSMITFARSDRVAAAVAMDDGYDKQLARDDIERHARELDEVGAAATRHGTLGAVLAALAALLILAAAWRWRRARPGRAPVLA